MFADVEKGGVVVDGGRGVAGISSPDEREWKSVEEERGTSRTIGDGSEGARNGVDSRLKGPCYAPMVSHGNNGSESWMRVVREESLSSEWR